MRHAAAGASARGGLLDNPYEAVRYADRFNRALRRHHPYSAMPTRVVGVARTAYIDQQLRIYVEHPSVLASRGVSTDGAAMIVYKGSVVHENLHAVAFPVVSRYKEVWSVTVRYLHSRGVPLEGRALERVFARTDNIVADVVNETMAVATGLQGADSLVAGKMLKAPPTGVDLAREEASNPAGALFEVHLRALAELDKAGAEPGSAEALKAMTRGFGDPGALRSSAAYNLILSVAPLFDPHNHALLAASGGYTMRVTGVLLSSGLYEYMDAVWRELRDDEPGDWRSLAAEARARFGSLALNAVYHALVALYYRLALERGPPRHPAACQLAEDAGMAPPSPWDAATAVDAAREGREEMTPEERERAARALLGEKLLSPAPGLAEDRQRSLLDPYLRNPWGRLEPRSLAEARATGRGPWLWRVEDEYPLPGERRASQRAGAPTRVTLVIDDSGSTGAPTGLLAQLVGRDVPVLDAERVVAAALAMGVLGRNPAATGVLVKFSSTVRASEGSLREVLDVLLGRREFEPEGAGTDIVSGVAEGVERHADRPDSPFVLITDLEVSEREEEEVYGMLKALRRSPVLVVVVGAMRLRVLSELNRRPNAAAVAVSAPWSVERLERAVRKVSRAALEHLS